MNESQKWRATYFRVTNSLLCCLNFPHPKALGPVNLNTLCMLYLNVLSLAGNLITFYYVKCSVVSSTSQFDCITSFDLSVIIVCNFCLVVHCIVEKSVIFINSACLSAAADSSGGLLHTNWCGVLWSALWDYCYFINEIYLFFGITCIDNGQIGWCMWQVLSPWVIKHHAVFVQAIKH